MALCGGILGTSNWEKTLGHTQICWRDHISHLVLEPPSDPPGGAVGRGWEEGRLCYSDVTTIQTQISCKKKNETGRNEGRTDGK